MTNCSILITTTDNHDLSRKLARELIAAGLSKCAQIDKVTSIYEWEGAVEEAQEYRVMFKVADKNLDAAQAQIAKLHNYALPEIIAVSIDAGSAAYINWLK